MPIATIPSIAGSNIGLFYNHPYWAVKLHGGMSAYGSPTVDEQWICEMDKRPSALFNPNHTYFDWTLDLVTTGDILRIEQLWMFCPKNRMSPNGNTATFFFTPEEAGTAFMFNVSRQSIERRIDHKIIGKVTDKQTGDCTCFIWDDELQVMGSPWKTNIYHFGTWRQGIPGKTSGVAPIGQLHHEVLGLRL